MDRAESYKKRPKLSPPAHRPTRAQRARIIYPLRRIQIESMALALFRFLASYRRPSSIPLLLNPNPLHPFSFPKTRVPHFKALLSRLSTEGFALIRIFYLLRLKILPFFFVRPC